MPNTRDFLLEIGCEEMPSRPLMNAQMQLENLAKKELKAAGLAYASLETLSTPRRLTLLVYGCQKTTEEVHESLRGPACDIAFDEAGLPKPAALGFARKCGVEVAELARVKADDGREYLSYERVVPSKEASTLLSEISRNIIGSLDWPNYRSQRWGSEHETFVRPIRWICALFGSDVVELRYADVVSSNITRGHRVLAPQDHIVPSASEYKDVLEKAFVFDEKKRAEIIRAGIAEIESSGKKVDTPQAIFDEVVNLCEYPTVLIGSFDEEFLAVPQEIICESMLSHQRYFPILDTDGKLTRDFVIVSNADPAVNDTVIQGNERVVRARLDDAKFFFEEDLKVSLEDFVNRLNDVVFHEKLGTVREKVDRIEAIALAAAKSADATAPSASAALRAAHLAKADLVSQAVVEFPSQQGIMGSYYALAAEEGETVATAIREHYRPRFAGDALPTTLEGAAVALADKLDTICGIFAIGEAPTGSSDPYAVRRSSIGVIAILREYAGIELNPLIDEAISALVSQGIKLDTKQVKTDVIAYFAGRLAAIAKDEDVSPDVIEAVSAVKVIEPKEYLARVHALEEARANNFEVFDDLATAYARASNLSDTSLGTNIDESLLTEPERTLLDACTEKELSVKDALVNSDYKRALAALAELREPIDRFFVDVLVMVDDTKLQENRLKILNRFSALFSDIADMSALVRKK